MALAAKCTSRPKTTLLRKCTTAQYRCVRMPTPGASPPYDTAHDFVSCNALASITSCATSTKRAGRIFQNMYAIPANPESYCYRRNSSFQDLPKQSCALNFAKLRPSTLVPSYRHATLNSHARILRLRQERRFTPVITFYARRACIMCIDAGGGCCMFEHGEVCRNFDGSLFAMWMRNRGIRFATMYMDSQPYLNFPLNVHSTPRW
jgi:hypothetical protein